jgi:hypothetical protein
VFDKFLTNDVTQSLYQQGDLVFENRINIGCYSEITDINSQNRVREKNWIG